MGVSFTFQSALVGNIYLKVTFNFIVLQVETNYCGFVKYSSCEKSFRFSYNLKA